MQSESVPVPETYGALILRAFAEGRISEEAYFYARSTRGRATYGAGVRPLPEIPSGGWHMERIT